MTKNNGKRAAAVLLALALALGAAACAQKGPAPQPEPDKPGVEQNGSAAQQQTPQETPPAAEPQPAEPSGEGEAQFLAAKAEYPAMLQYPDNDNWEAIEAWMDQRYERGELYPADPEMVAPFMTAALPHLLAGTDGENTVCSPMNVYLALAMAAELSGGESREQLLTLLGTDSLEALEERVDTLWNACYCDDGTSVSILASSLWMRDDMPCLKGTVHTLRDVYRASSYRGDMSDPRYTQALRDWLNEQTGGQLAGAVDDVTLDAQTLLELVTTVYFRARWLERFDAANTYPQTFHAPDGDAVCDFMHDEWADFWMYRGAHFSAVRQYLENAGSMWFLLPDEGVTPEELLKDPEAVAFLSGGVGEAEWYYGKLALPKLDVISDLELSDALGALGVTDVFDPARADLSGLFEGLSGAALTSVRHAARLTMDEEGVTATAFTAMGYGAGAPERELDFTLDRPFLFVLMTENNLPLFAGMVHMP